ALFKSLYACLQLCLGLVRKTVAHAHGIFVQLQTLISHNLPALLDCKFIDVRRRNVAPVSRPAVMRASTPACANQSRISTRINPHVPTQLQPAGTALSKRLLTAHNPNPGL